MITLGAVQLKIMRVLWSEQNATARRITEVVSKETPIAHSTVQTLLRQLEAKKAVAHELEERTFCYRPLVAENEVGRSAAQDLLERVFRGSVSGLVAHLLDNEEIPDEEISRLKQLIEKKEKENRS